MPSLVILMIEAEQPEGLSARKLVVETAKHNVLTAYSKDEGLDLLRRFPNIDAILVHSAILEDHPNLLLQIRESYRDVPIILAAPFGNLSSPHATFAVDSHHPQQLLQIITHDIHPRFPQ